MPLLQHPKQQTGATLIEVLIAVVVLSIGLLGLAGLQVTSVQSNYSAYQRSQATVLANDIAERMRANRTAALAGAYDDTTMPASSSSNAVTGNQAAKDKAQWRNNLALTLPSGTGQVTRNNDLVTITIRWNDNRGRISQSNAAAAADTDFIYRTEI